MFNETEIVEGAAFQPTTDPVGRRYKVRLIEGNKLGSTGYYPAETLLRDGPKIFTKGTPMYLNHMTAEERAVRPFGSVESFAGELAEDAYYDGDGLYADIEVFEHHMPMIKSLKDKIGISIRARGLTVNETINGKSVPVFKELTMARSADFVVKAGAGGKIVSILESAIEDSETDSEALEEGQVVMDVELKEALAGLATGQAALAKAMTEIAESLKPVEEEATESAVDALAVARELSESELGAEGRERVLERFAVPGNKKTLAELIEAEEAYVKKATVEAEESAGAEEREQEAEESAGARKITLPGAWSTKDKK